MASSGTFGRSAPARVQLLGTLNCWNKTRYHGSTSSEKRTVRLAGASLWVSDGTSIVNWMMEDMEAFDERKVNLDKDPSEGSIGLSILGGVDRGEPITVGRLVDNSPAQHCGKVFPKDIILNVNGHSTLTLKHNEVTQLLHDAKDTVCLHLVKLRQKAVGSTDMVEEAAPIDMVKLIENNLTELSLEAATLTRYNDIDLIPNGFRIINSDCSLDYTLQCYDQQELDMWISHLTNAIIEANSSKMKELNKQFGLDDIIMFGSVHELLPSTKHSSNWLKKLLVLRKATLQIYSSLPKCIEKWERPEQSYKLYKISLRQLNELPSAISATTVTREHCVIIQCGTGHNHIISFEYSNVLNKWIDAIHQTTIRSVLSIKQREYNATWKDQSVIFCINLQTGFMILKSDTRDVLWHQPFSRLLRSSDNGHTIMILTFKNGTSIEIDLANNMHIAICTMEAFLMTKLNRID